MTTTPVSPTSDSLLALSALVPQVARVRAIPVIEDGREIGTRFEVETTDGTVRVMQHVPWRALIEMLDEAGATLTHINLGLDMYCKGTEEIVSWPAGAPEPEVKTEDPAEEPTQRPGTVEEAIEQMAAKGKANRPALASRLDSAAELVRDGRVVLDGETARVGPYTITANSCNCADYVHRGGWCKHRLAARMARHLVAHGFVLPAAEEATPRPIISEANRRLIASGAVMDAERRTWAAYRSSGEGARRWAITALGSGARTLPAHIARRAGIAPSNDGQ